MKNRLIVITGPTASGKTALAVRLAQSLNTDVISADSRQIYRGIPIVTAVPSPEEMGGVTHHFIEEIGLEDYYSAAMYEADALQKIRDLFRQHESVVVCGGSMMYVDALCNGIDELPTVPDNVRAGLTDEWKEKGDEYLLNELKRLDPNYYERVDLRNMKRVFHAVEVSIASGQPYSSLLTGQKATREFQIEKYCIEMERDLLFRRIGERVDRMVKSGLIEEAERVYPLKGLNSLNTVGLKELFAVFDGEMDMGVAIERIKKNTRVYAKKQMTWYKRDPDVKYISSDVDVRKLI